MEIIGLLFGFVCLIKGADFFVDGASSLAKKLGVPAVLVGLTIAAIGTSLPEASVSVISALHQNPEIAISNVLGSNLFNTLMVIGCCAIIFPIHVGPELKKRDIPFNVLISAVLCLIAVCFHRLSRLAGAGLLAALVVYLVYLCTHTKIEKEEQPGDMLPPGKIVLYILGGLIAIVAGGQLVVNNATAIATALGWSQTLIGVTIVAIGTSLPELVTSLVACKKGESGLGLGNAVGSNIFNILFILGASSAIAPYAINAQSVVDCVLVLLVAVLLFVLSRNEKISKKEGVLFVLLYVAYSVYVFLR
ncbi:calcium/sodium antiporter [Dubosiella muris]|mgnify:CR=1 FL=1|uniref:Calcium/sodium antiporter n=1 Tax=Dubosiella muris TaxID=3038133 RepID=A0AC61R4P0_9FIRM|nr:calcium/sodium antiporter [Dubosiella muris]TGY64940.1 calcium/sodium antiporter [Dubosiella muris]